MWRIIPSAGFISRVLLARLLYNRTLDKTLTGTHPGILLDGQVDCAQLVGRNAECNNLTYAHHDVPGDDLCPLRGEFLPKAGLIQVRINFGQCFGLIVPHENRQQDGILFQVVGMHAIRYRQRTSAA